MKAEQFHFYEARVNVKNRGTLRPDADLNDGAIIKVQYAWMMDEHDPFPGQVAFVRHRGYWIPEEDLTLIKEITFDDFIATH